jgi:hypothetical protein
MNIKAKESFTKTRMETGLSIVPKTAKAISKALNKSFEELFIIEKGE